MKKVVNAEARTKVLNVVLAHIDPESNQVVAGGSRILSSGGREKSSSNVTNWNARFQLALVERHPGGVLTVNSFGFKVSDEGEYWKGHLHGRADKFNAIHANEPEREMLVVEVVHVDELGDVLDAEVLDLSKKEAPAEAPESSENPEA